MSILIKNINNINQFNGKTFVIKYGGSIIENEKVQKTFFEDIVLLMRFGIKIIIVHGGGKNISQELDKLGIKANFVRGLRVTDEKTMEVVEMILTGNINKKITDGLFRRGVKAIGISGRDLGLIKAKKKYIYENGNPIDIGFVGEVTSINTEIFNDLIDKGYLPVVSPIGCDDMGNIYNINADYVAASVSAAVRSEKLILLTDVAGVYEDISNPETLISTIKAVDIEKYIETGIIKNGMIPKLECCKVAIKGGTKNVHLIDGRKEHSILLELTTKGGIGTVIKGGQ